MFHDSDAIGAIMKNVRITASAFTTMFGGMDCIPSALRMSDMTTTIFR